MGAETNIRLIKVMVTSKRVGLLVCLSPNAYVGSSSMCEFFLFLVSYTNEIQY